MCEVLRERLLICLGWPVACDAMWVARVVACARCKVRKKGRGREAELPNCESAISKLEECFLFTCIVSIHYL